ncbi:MAG: alpha/beta hydrolase [Chloroflexi bacterium]|nr:alpha/beta hydrolase [Chloroflexota bacterium]
MPKIRINDVGIYYEMIGQGEPVLFIHGLASSSRSWEKQIPLFSQHYRVITFDLRGHGRSDKPLGPYSIEQFAADAIELLRTLDIKSANLVGFSLGGMVGFQMAVEAPEKVKGLVAVNCCPEGSVRSFDDGIDCFKHILLLQLNGTRKMRQCPNRQPLPIPNNGQSRQSVTERLAVRNKLAYASAFRSLMGWSVVNRLHTIACPILLIASDQDYIPVSVKQAYVSKMPRAELAVIGNSGHATPREQVEEFNNVVMEFLSKQSRTTHNSQLRSVR